MFQKFFLVYAVLISLVVSYANWTGWKIVNFSKQAGPRPVGRAVYHK